MSDIQDKTQLSTAEIIEIAGNMNGCSNEMHSKLTAISEIVMKLESTSLQCDAGRSLGSTMKKLNAKIEEYKKVTDTYVNYLKETVEDWVETEKVIASNADQFDTF